MNEEYYDDQPWLDKAHKEKLRQEAIEQKRLLLKQEDYHKREAYIPFVLQEPVKTPEEIAQSKRGAIDLFASPGKLESKKAIEYATIIASGSGFRESFE